MFAFFITDILERIENLPERQGPVSSTRLHDVMQRGDAGRKRKQTLLDYDIELRKLQIEGQRIMNDYYKLKLRKLEDSL